MERAYDSELTKLKSTAAWADKLDISTLVSFLYARDTDIPLISIGSGGSLSACHYAALLYGLGNGTLSAAMTPLKLKYSGPGVIRSSKLLYLSAGGKNHDIQNALKLGVKHNERGMMCLSLHKNSPAERLLDSCPGVARWCEDIPCGKDGFLATNSLLATFALLSRASDGEAVGGEVDFDGSYTTNRDTDLTAVRNFIVLYGAAGEPVAKDIESKLTEAALGAALPSDYRNFGHGCYHWFDKRGEGSCIVALVSPAEKELAGITLGLMPPEIPVIYIETELALPKASVDLLVKAFRFVRDLGRTRDYDPGDPGVPPYGKTLYNMDYPL